MQARQKVLATRVSGTVVEWKGKFGWIQSDTPINHPDYAKRKGRIYLSLSDVDSGQPAEGKKVSFLVYTDGNGLGAMNCKAADGTGVQKPISKPQTLGPGGGIGVGAKRESLGDDQYTGKLAQWNGSFGFIAPIDTITHPLFKGKIYLKGNDVDSAEPLTVGMLVTFFLYTDSQGLGAEHVTPADADASPLAEEKGPSVLKAKPKGGFPQSPMPPSSPPPSPGPGDGDSVVLKAKPKMAAGPPPESSMLKAKPKMSAGGVTLKPTTNISLPAHLSETLAQRLVTWMWDRGG